MPPRCDDGAIRCDACDACRDAAVTVPQDLVVPSWKLPQHYISSPLLGAVPQERDVLLYFQVCHGSTA